MKATSLMAAVLVMNSAVVLAEMPTCVVVVDPQSDQYYAGQFGGYYFSRELSRVAKQELEIALSRRGFQVLLNTEDVRPTQEELLLENSKWGQDGRGRNNIGYFTGADETFLVSAWTYGSRDADLRVRFENLSPSVRIAKLKVKTLIRRSLTKTREVPEIHEGFASKRIVKDVSLGIHSGNPWVRLASTAIEASLTSWQDAGRAATRGAIENALKGVRSPQVLAPTDPVSTAPRYIYLALRDYASEGDRFVIWRNNNRQIAEVVVEELLRDGRARCRVLHCSVNDLGKPGDKARTLTPTIPVE